MSERYRLPTASTFDRRREDFGEYGGYVLNYLCDPALNQPAAVALHKDDWKALIQLGNVYITAKVLRDPLAGLDSTYSLLYNFNEQWGSFHAALPFTETERQWLVDHMIGASVEVPVAMPEDASAEQLATAISLQEATIVSAGLHKVVNGGVLLQRWLDWRRETGDYRGQGTLDIARHALHDLMLITDPNASVPDSYLRLTQQQ
jgi:hypothetical protein